MKVPLCHSVIFSWSTAVSVCQMLQFLFKVNIEKTSQKSSLLRTVDEVMCLRGMKSCNLAFVKVANQ